MRLKLASLCIGGGIFRCIATLGTYVKTTTKVSLAELGQIYVQDVHHINKVFIEFYKTDFVTW